jgi:hypothetical protein
MIVTSSGLRQGPQDFDFPNKYQRIIGGGDIF